MSVEKIELENGAIKLFRGDALEVLETLDDESVDAVVSDPPYNCTDLPTDQEKVDWVKVWSTIRRVRKPASPAVLFSSQRAVVTLINSNEKEFRYWWVWRKNTPTFFLSCRNFPLRVHEVICVFTPVGKHRASTYRPVMVPAGKVFKRGGNRQARHWGTFKPMETESDEKYPVDVIDFSVDTARCNSTTTHTDTFHPSQKPADLMAYLISTYSKPGDTILDMYGGSGTTAVAAIRTGRKCILVEKEPVYFELARKRIEDAIRGERTLFSASPGQANGYGFRFVERSLFDDPDAGQSRQETINPKLMRAS